MVHLVANQPDCASSPGPHLFDELIQPVTALVQGDDQHCALVLQDLDQSRKTPEDRPGPRPTAWITGDCWGTYPMEIKQSKHMLE